MEDETNNAQETREVFIPSRKFIDDRLNALLNLIEVSMAPAMALMPKSKREEIQGAYDELKGMVCDDRAEEQ